MPPTADPQHVDPGADATVESRPPFLERVRPLVATGEAFRWISEPRRWQYAVILHSLFARRQGHEHEVANDDLLEDVLATPAPGGGGPYDPQQLRGDIEQLRRWGNVIERVEPLRIKRLSDRGRSKLLLRLAPQTAAFLAFLDTEAQAEPLGLRDRGTNLLEDLLLGLVEARRVLRQSLTSDTPERREALLQRGSHLIHEADQKAAAIAEELVQFGDALAAFLAEPFRVEVLVELTTWLEHYVERYVGALAERGVKIRRALGLLGTDAVARAIAAADEREAAQLAKTPAALRGRLSPRPHGELLASLRAFFDENRGLAALCRRINRRTRDVIRRVQRHVEAVRLRNVRTEAIGARIGELVALPTGAAGDQTALEFVDALVAPLVCRADARPGTPRQRVAPPRPARRYESHRPEFRGAVLAPKASAAGSSHRLERRRLEELSAFVERAVLRGRGRARLGEASLHGIADGKSLVRAVAAWYLQGGRSRPHLGYRLHRPPHPTRAHAGDEDFVVDFIDLGVRRRDDQ